MNHVFNPYLGMTMEDFSVLNDSHRSAVATVGKYIENLDIVRENGRGLVFLGPNGVGKTALASIVLNAVAEHGYRIEAIELAAYVGLCKDQFSLSQIMRRTDDDEWVDRYVKTRQHVRSIRGITKRCADWVLFDDVGREFPSESGWSQGEFFDNLRSRWDRGLPSILTTNLPMEELDLRYTEGVTSLLLESTTVIVMEGDDYRCRKVS